jgi:integrase
VVRTAKAESRGARTAPGWHATLSRPSPRRRVIYAKSHEEARRKLTEALADRGRGLVYDSGTVTVQEYLERWLEDSVRGSIKVTTHAGYERVVRLHVCPTLGHTKLSALTPACVQTLYRAKLDEGLAPKSVKHIHTTLHRALKQAVRWGLVPRNAAAAVDPPRVETPEIRPLSSAQSRTLLAAAEGNRLEALFVLALGWEDVDLEVRVVRVRRALTLARGGPRLTEPKTPKSRQSIRLTSGH